MVSINVKYRVCSKFLEAEVIFVPFQSDCVCLQAVAVYVLCIWVYFHSCSAYMNVRL